jgi:uncharacterized membrane protein
MSRNKLAGLLRLKPRNDETFWHHIIIFAVALIFSGLYLYLGARGYFVGGDDALFHISRYFSVMRGWLDGQIVPQTDPTFLSGIGHSWNIFYGPLPAYFTAIVFRVILNWQFAIALTMFGAVWLAGIFAYRFMKDIFAKLSWGKAAALVGAIIYIWSPYLIIDFYGRAAIGEVFAFIFLPLVFHGLWRLINNGKNSIVLLTAGMTGLILSHSLSVVIALVFGTLFLLLNIKKIIPNWRKTLINTGISIALVFGLSAFFTLPFIENMSLGIYAINNDWFAENIMYFNSESINNNRLSIFNSWLGTRNYSFYLVVILALASALAAVFLRPKEKVKTDIKKFFALLALALILTTTLIDWRLVPDALYTIQFPTRFMGLASLLAAIVAGYGLVWLIEKIKSKPFRIASVAVFAVLVIASGLTRIPWDVDRNIDADNLSTTTNTGLNEYYTMGFLKDGFSTQLADSGWQYIVHGDAKIEDFEFNANSSERKFHVSAESESTIELAQVYYAGFQATDQQGEKLATTYSDNGLVKLTIPANFSGQVTSKFQNSPTTTVGLSITFATCLSIAVFCIIKSRRRRSK